jgi:DNA-directed RNA polymerase subunit RPC12/RpoP
METTIRLVQETFYMCSVCGQEFEELHTCSDHEAKCNCEHYFVELGFCPETFMLERKCMDCSRVLESIDMVDKIVNTPPDIRQSMLKKLRDAVIVPEV